MSADFQILSSVGATQKVSERDGANEQTVSATKSGLLTVILILAGIYVAVKFLLPGKLT